MKRNHNEHYQQAGLFQWRDRAIGLYPQLKWMYAIPNSARRTPQQGAWMKAEGMRKGIWDVHLPYPVQKLHGLWIEMKTGANKLTPEQTEFMMDNKTIFAFAVCYSWEEAKNAILLYLGGDRF